jgi:hypothetical protein
LGDRETILYIAVVFLSIPGLGPGFGNQYYYWFMPFLVVSYAAYHSLWRKLLIGFAIISAVTFTIEYGLNPAFGYNILFLMSHTTTQLDLYHAWKTSQPGPFMTAAHWAQWVGSPAHQTIERIPLFIAMLTIIVVGARILFLTLQEVRKWVVGLAGIYALWVVMVFAAAFGVKCLWPGTPPEGNSSSGQSGQNVIQN